MKYYTLFIVGLALLVAVSAPSAQDYYTTAEVDEAVDAIVDSLVANRERTVAAHQRADAAYDTALAAYKKADRPAKVSIGPGANLLPIAAERAMMFRDNLELTAIADSLGVGVEQATETDIWKARRRELRTVRERRATSNMYLEWLENGGRAGEDVVAERPAVERPAEQERPLVQHTPSGDFTTLESTVRSMRQSLAELVKADSTMTVRLAAAEANIKSTAYVAESAAKLLAYFAAERKEGRKYGQKDLAKDTRVLLDSAAMAALEKIRTSSANE